MHLGFTEQEDRFRLEVREFLRSQTPPRHWDYWETSESARQQHRAIALKLGERGWIGLSWPKEFGGGGKSRREALILSEELAYFGNPGINRAATALMGPNLISHGTDEQRSRLLPGILSGRTFWCQGFSEPNAGSDLASIRTAARADGDDFVISGQKIWTSFAHQADWIFLLARTGEPEARHRNLTFFVSPMSAAGITVRPIRHMAGHITFCEVFLDGLRIPRSNVIGEVDRGWQVAMGTLAEERSGIEYAGTNRRIVEELIALLRTRGRDLTLAAYQGMRLRLAELAAEMEASRLLCYRAAWLAERGQDMTADAAMSKVFGSELMGRLTRLGIDILGRDSQSPPRNNGEPGDSLAVEYMTTLGRIIAAGSSEIMRNVIGSRGLGLPS